jgi:hypothetical protein
MRLCFGDFELDAESYRLLCRGREVPIEPRAMDLLCYLAARPNRLVSKDELLSEVWKLPTLSEGVLSNTVGKLRQVLGQDAKASTPIETVRGRGYRWRGAEPTVCSPAVNIDREPYIGRVAVLAQLARAVAAAASGAGQLLLLVGEPGIGKTRTLVEIARRAAGHGFRVFSGSAYEGAGAPAYWPWVEVLRAAHDTLGPVRFRNALPEGASALPVLVPDLLGGDHSLADDDWQQRAQRFRLFDELTRLLGVLSQDAQCLIVLDDLQWSDAATLDLLAYAVRALAQRPVLFAAALREREIQRSPVHAPALPKLVRLATRIELTGLAEHDVSQLVAALGCAPAMDARASRVLQHRTQGNPFFVRQFLALLAERSLQPAADDIESLQLPAAIQSVLEQRLTELDETTRRVLAAAAVIGGELSVHLLAELLEQPVADTLRALESASRTGVIVQRRDTPQQFTFVHALLRDVLYAGLGVTRRGALHAKLVRVLDRRGSHDPRVLGEVARHALWAVPFDLSACIQHCRRAAHAARNASGFEVAVEMLSLALDKHTTEGGEPGDACQLLLELALDQLCTGDQTAATQTLERGATLAHNLGRADLLAGFVCRMIDWLEFTGDERVASLWLERALAAASDTDLRTRVALLGRAARVRPELPVAERHALFALAASLAEQLGDPEASIDLAYSRVSLRDPTEAHTIAGALDHYNALCERYPLVHAGIRDDMRRLTVNLTEFLAAQTIGDITRGDIALSRACAAGARCQVPVVDTVLGFFSAGRQLAAGRLDELDQIVQRQMARPGEEGSDSLQGGWLIYAWLVAHAQGKLERWAGVDTVLTEQMQRVSHGRQRRAIKLWIAWLQVHTGRPSLAAAGLRALAPELLATEPVRYGDLGLLCQAADVTCAVGWPELGDLLYERLEPHSDCQALGVLGESWGSVAHHLGTLAALQADEASRLTQLRRAAKAHASWGLPLALARTEALLAGGS